MKKTLIAAVAFLMMSGAAMACSVGASGYPMVTEMLEQSTIAPEKKAMLTALLDKGRAIHAEGERTQNTGMMAESIAILEKVKEGMNN